MALRLCPSFSHPLIASSVSVGNTSRIRRCSIRNCILEPNESRKLVLEVKEKLEKEYPSLPLGRNGRDDDDMILWFLKDRRFSVEEAVSKLSKAIKWRQEFGVSELSEENVKAVAQTGKAYVHDFPDVDGRPVLVVVGSKHVPLEFDPSDDEKLCVFLLEKALSRLPTGKEQIIGIVDLRGFRTENADLKFLTFLVKFCSAESVRKEYFTPETLPASFGD
ncbi:sec14 cytosolic factor isoform X2 [Prosopis cineraria]|uniref:sec14 cytosolic factor isoform X2 n=1 Tax=Prosopis cineraria TaxID=364024 RepID=UPI00240FD241|nr:sec14 cytosolic factor isoform X2 [Prosopis cineraria]